MKRIESIVIVLGLLLCFLFIRCSSYKIETLKVISRTGGYDTAVYYREKPYLTKKQIKEFKHQGLNKRDSNLFKIYHIIYYVWINDTILVKSREGYYYTDATVGKQIIYYPDGKISVERNYILYNDSTKKVISMEDFNRIKNKGKNGDQGYDAQPDGAWKYYSKEGKLIKEEIYDKGTLKRTINY
jgi:hypothetical protein